MHIEIPYSFERYYYNRLCVLYLKHSIYGLKQSNYNFYKKLSKVLEARKIRLCASDSCLFVSKNLIVLVYVGNVLIFSKRKICIDLFIKSLIDGDENFELTDKDNIDKYLGVDIKDYADGSYEI